MRRIKFAAIALTAWFLPLVTRAVDTTEAFLEDIGREAEYVTNEPLPLMVGRVINIFLSVVGIILVVLLVYGGYLWMTARGEEDRVKEAKSTIRNAVIGLVIILLAYSISSFVVRALVNASFGIP